MDEKPKFKRSRGNEAERCETAVVKLGDDNGTSTMFSRIGERFDCSD